MSFLKFSQDKSTYTRLLRYLAPYKTRFALALLASIPASSLNGVIAWVIGPFLDAIVKGNGSGYLFWMPVSVVGITLLQGLFEYVSDYYTNYVSFAVTKDIRKELYQQLNKMDLRYFKTHSSGDLVTRYYTDPTSLQQAIVTNLQGFIVQFFTGLFLAIVLFTRNWQLACCAILIISLIAIPLYFISQKIRRLDHHSRVISASLADIVYESLFGIKEILAFERQSFQEKRFQKALKEFFSASMRITKSETILKPLMQFIAGLGIAVIVMLSTSQIQQGTMSHGDVASFLVALVLLYKPVKVIATIIGKIQRILAPAERVFEKIDLQPALLEVDEPETVGLLKTLAFQNVHFHYQPDKPVLRGINLTVQAGETIALVGTSGGGKTTLVELIPRFLDPTEGEILYNGINLKQLSLSTLRSKIAMVAQDTVLFSGSVADNIRFGNLHATDAEIAKVAEQANLTSWIESLPLGFATSVGERGCLVSGGQKQRISIARALLKDAPILILDEATSALDNESEQHIQDAIKTLMKDRTVFVVAHRLSTIKSASRIVVLSGGKIIETGTHDILLKQEGLYSRLYQLQFLSATNPNF